MLPNDTYKSTDYKYHDLSPTFVYQGIRRKERGVANQIETTNAAMP